MGHWIVARTKSKRERWAAENVQRLGFDYYMPVIERVQIHRGIREVKTDPLFPSYLFVMCTGPWRMLLSTWGISTVILRGDQPAIMPISEIDRLRKYTDENGMVQLPDQFKKGQNLIVRHGPFAGHQTLCDGMAPNGRVKCLIDLLGGKTKVLFDAEMLEVA